MHTNPAIVNTLARLKGIHYVLISIAITVFIVSAFSVAFHGRITKDYMITGLATCTVASLLVVGLLKIHQRALDLEISRRKAAEQAKDLLIEQLNQALVDQRELVDLKEKKKEQELQLTIKNEKLKTLHLAMGKVLHYVNNLANNLQIITLEYRSTRQLSEETMHALDEAIVECSSEMRALASVEDPFKEEQFRVVL